VTTERARNVVQRLRELKVQIGDEVRGATSDEHEALQRIFARLATTTVRLEAGTDDAAVVQIEVEQARAIAMEQRDLLLRRHLNLALPAWRAPMSRDANMIFYSGPEAGRRIAAEIAKPLRAALDEPSHAADAAAARWRSLRAASAAIFDLTGGDAQVHYELGVALTLGTHTVVIAAEGTRPAFDVGQEVRTYAARDLPGVLGAAIDDALYGAAPSTDPRSSVDAAVKHAKALAAAEGTRLATTIFCDLPEREADPMQAHSLLRLLDSLVPERNVVVLRSRWAAAFPDAGKRCFVVMPFREDLAPTWAAIRRASEPSGTPVVRGDEAAGQEIIRSIWNEIGRATEVIVDLTGFNTNVCIELGIADTLGKPVLLIGMAGTETELTERFPSMAKRRCHAYFEPAELAEPLARFFSGGLSWG
jgi:nucleoside 2-deoxyribosyltransferase